METNAPPGVWDVSVALRDLCFEMLPIHEAGASADSDTVRRWHQWISRSALAHSALAVACEDIVEGGATPERIVAMKQALTHAMGQTEYWPRVDRW